MKELHVEVEGTSLETGGWTLRWVDEEAGIARLSDGQRTETVVVEGSGSNWHVTVRGRRIGVTVRTRREQLLAEAAVASGAQGGPVEVRATLPGLVVAITAGQGTRVAAGDSLLTIEAMKMQNEVRAPREGTVAEVAVAAGQPVATGALLLRLE